MDRVRLQRTPPFIEPLNYEGQRRPNEDDVPKGSGLAYTLYSAVKPGGAVLLLAGAKTTGRWGQAHCSGLVQYRTSDLHKIENKSVTSLKVQTPGRCPYWEGECEGSMSVSVPLLPYRQVD